MFELRILLLILLGLGLIAVVAVERFAERTPVSMPIIYVAAGWLVFTALNQLGYSASFSTGGELPAVEYLTELIVIISLMSAGLAIDRPFSWRGWQRVLPLLLITMPVSIALVSFFAWEFIGLALPSAILLGAVLSPTDPVLADSVQVAPPGEQESSEVRFALTVEAGVNDGLAFPFTYLAIALLGAGSIGTTLTKWAAFDLIYAVLAGIAVGYLVGRFSGWYIFRDKHQAKSSEKNQNLIYQRRKEGLVVLGTVFAAYGLAEIIAGYGFLAVFVAAVCTRQHELSDGYHKHSHRFMDQLEQCTLVVMLFGFGAMLASGVLNAITPELIFLSLAIIFVVRPLAGLVALSLGKLTLSEKLAVSFLGIRGIGSIYYLSYAQNKANFSNLDTLWAVTALVILISIIVHGIFAQVIVRKVEARGQNRTSS